MESTVHIYRFFYLFIGAAIAIVLGNSLYYSILSMVDNVIVPTILKLLAAMGVDTDEWDYKNYNWIEFFGDMLTFSLAILLSYILWIQFTKGSQTIPNINGPNL